MYKKIDEKTKKIKLPAQLIQANVPARRVLSPKPKKAGESPIGREEPHSYIAKKTEKN